ncbi:uncharacterized protein [Bemisia tabaci]|uniref:uncharacterized protein n=1 Tax=Bemisia tabaci TaxID=7038 RepID=UPI003B28A884
MFSDQLQRKTSLAVNHLMLDFKDEPTEQTARSFLKFSSEKMDSAICAALERKTIKQSKCPLWFDLHFGRVSASKLWEAAHCTTEDGTLRDSILGAKKFKGTKAMSDGLDLEPLVRKKVQRELNTKIKEAGMFMRSKYSIFGASPDGITETHVFEIKCPASASTFQTYFRDGAPEKEYMAQMQLQMLLTGRRKGYFCVAAHDFKDSGNVTIIEVKFDKAFLEPLLNAAAEFWIKYIFPILYK